MLSCVDVAYDQDTAFAGCVVFAGWEDGEPQASLLATVPLTHPYRPGELYLRELPPILAVLQRASAAVATVIVDGYVWLGGARAGLGAHLYEALGRRVAVVGVAKTAWAERAPPDAPERAIAVLRGTSRNPLFVTAAGMDVEAAAAHVARMHGKHRLPTLLRAVDRLVREQL
jgi:deoxyribonuclease V